MRKFLHNRPLIIAIVAVVVLVILIAVTAGSRSMTFIESAVGSVVQPVQTFASNASAAIIDFFNRLFRTTDADLENEQLHLRITQLEQQAIELEDLRQENERLREMLHFAQSNTELEYVSASVIGKSQGIWFDTFTINVGRNHGIEAQMPVVTADGLVGRVTEVGATWSKVSAVIDPRTSVSVMVQRTRVNGMVRGRLESGTTSDVLELYYLPANSDLVPGDIIVTSGLGGIYPKGIMVGEITEVARSDEGDYNALLTAAVDFNHIEEVMVILNTNAQEQTAP